MAALDFFVGPIRSILGTAESSEAALARHSPLGATRELEHKIEEAVDATHRAVDSLERHIAVVETLADSLAPLTESVTRLSDQLGAILQVMAPLAGAERELSRAEHFFARHRRGQQPSQPGPDAPG